MAQSTLLRSRKLIGPFAVHAPATVAEAIALKASHPPAWFMAGGIEIADRLKHGLPCGALIRLDRISELTTIGLDRGRLRIGAAVSHRAIAADPLVRRHLPRFAEAVASIGSPRIRAQGTIGGNVMCGAQHYDILPILMALSATLVFGEANCARREQAAETGLAHDPNNLLISIALPIGTPHDFRFERIDKPILSLAVALSKSPAGNATARIVLACPGQEPLLRVLDVEAAIAASVTSWRASLPEYPDDRNTSAWYRDELSQVRLRRLLTHMLGATT